MSIQLTLDRIATMTAAEREQLRKNAERLLASGDAVKQEGARQVLAALPEPVVAPKKAPPVRRRVAAPKKAAASKAAG